MKRNFSVLLCMLGLIAPISGAQMPVPTPTVQAPMVQIPVKASAQVAQGVSDALLTTFPLASSLINYGWCESGLLSVAKTLGVDISVLVAIIALQQQRTQQDPTTGTITTQPVTIPRGFSYYAGCTAGIGILGALVAYKSWSCDESAFSVLVKAGLRTLITRVTGAALKPLLKKAEVSPESEQALDLLKQLFVDDYITRKVQPQLLGAYIKPAVA